MARHRPATLVHPGRHATWYGDDAQRSRAIALLNALLGSWGRRGGFYQPAMMSVPGYPYPPYPASARGKADNPGRKYPYASEAITTGLRHATITGEPYPIRGWVTYATNLLQALPNEAETIEAIQKLDLLVVVDVVGSEMAGWADVVLPEATYLERYDDLNVELFREPFVALRQPVVEAPADQKPNWWIARALALKLGLGAYYPWKTIEEYLDHRLRAAGLSLDALKKAGVVRGTPPPVYFEEGVEARVRDALEEDRVLLGPAEGRGLRPGPEVQAARGRAAGLLPPALRPRSRAHVQPDPDEPGARAGHARERGVA